MFGSGRMLVLLSLLRCLHDSPGSRQQATQTIRLPCHTQLRPLLSDLPAMETSKIRGISMLAIVWLTRARGL